MFITKYHVQYKQGNTSHKSDKTEVIYLNGVRICKRIIQGSSPGEIMCLFIDVLIGFTHAPNTETPPVYLKFRGYQSDVSWNDCLEINAFVTRTRDKSNNKW